MLPSWCAERCHDERRICDREEAVCPVGVSKGLVIRGSCERISSRAEGCQGHLFGILWVYIECFAGAGGASREGQYLVGW